MKQSRDTQEHAGPAFRCVRECVQTVSLPSESIQVRTAEHVALAHVAEHVSWTGAVRARRAADAVLEHLVAMADGLGLAGF